MKEALLIFDIGKTHKKVLLFDKDLELLAEEEASLPETTDEDGFPCEDATLLEYWFREGLQRYLTDAHAKIAGVNISTYGATLVYLDAKGRRLTPIYNYLREMPHGILESFYAEQGGLAEFSRQTASPALGMLNSGMQLRWMKNTRQMIYDQIKGILHLPQYMGYLLHGRILSEHTSIGCHTMLWDFDTMQYHSWIDAEGVKLPSPVSVSTLHPVRFDNRDLRAGTGIHDSSASLVPYLEAARKPFVLVSTGTWCISMNPFNHEPLSAAELENDCLCYLSIHQKPVKSSRLFLGRIHDRNMERIRRHFGGDPERYKSFRPRAGEVDSLWAEGRKYGKFFLCGIPEGLVDEGVDLSEFPSFEDAYAQLMADLCCLVAASIELVLAEDDPTKDIFITGGFARNKWFTAMMAKAFPEKRVHTSRLDNASALGAAMILARQIWPDKDSRTDLGLIPVSN